MKDFSGHPIIGIHFFAYISTKIPIHLKQFYKRPLITVKQNKT